MLLGTKVGDFYTVILSSVDIVRRVKSLSVTALRPCGLKMRESLPEIVVS